jgi:hypothetical protein
MSPAIAALGCRICEIRRFETIEQNLIGCTANDEEIIRACELFNWQEYPDAETAL